MVLDTDLTCHCSSHRPHSGTKKKQTISTTTWSKFELRVLSNSKIRIWERSEIDFHGLGAIFAADYFTIQIWWVALKIHFPIAFRFEATITIQILVKIQNRNQKPNIGEEPWKTDSKIDFSINKYPKFLIL